tara:strand:+ start:3569 stop:4954 length:1386 start_codon:yes stop_codon:yes gene_type:complete
MDKTARRTQIDELRSKQENTIGEARSLLEKIKTEDRSITTDETQRWEQLTAQAAELKSEISREVTQLGLEEDSSLPRRRAPSVDVRSGQGEPPPDAATALGLTKGDQSRYSIIRACRAYHKGSWETAPFELECHEALEKHHNRSAMGFFVPTEALLIEPEHHGLSEFDARHYVPQDAESRAAIGKVAPTVFGAALVATDLLSGSFIELLRNRTLVAQMGATILPNLVGDVDIPRQSAGAVATWVATEGTAVGEDQVETDTVSLTPKTVGVYTDITRRMLKQSSVGIEALVRRDIQLAIGLAVDLGAISGDASGGAPRGIIETGSVGQVTTSGDLDWANIVEFETDVAAANADRGAMGFLVTAAIRGIMKTKEKAGDVARFLMDMDGTTNSYRVEVSNQVPASHILFGNFNDLLIGEWGGLDMLADPYSLGTSGGLRLHGYQDVDVAVRHPASFSIATDATA